ncbi:hypothetical protein SYJ56_01395 [Algoriphagus sp. D3-2-R+10]|uniref:hypothetical protein n=1 Tax=Algoriphagus aurantiacus TaxID=3103948 RepID=UPI002B3C1A93|nr:hypothetical protein [Algoriphagus sp. D3-2-R+10]MEB2773941.1 hypothetical protein [Algoriphagus sp. D3-2-R+10]
MPQFIHKNQSHWSGFHLIGVLLISIALIIWVTSYLIDNKTDPLTLYTIIGISFLLGLLSLSTFTGTLIDFEGNKFKEYQSIFWIKFGEWQELAKIEHAELILHSFRRTNIPNGISPTLSREITIYKCVLVAGGTKFISLDFAREKEAIKALQALKSGLGIV